jgi:integrase
VSEPAAAVSVVPVRAASDLDRLKRLVLAGISSPNSRRAYGKALEDFLAWYQRQEWRPFCKLVVQEYRAYLEELSLAPSTINIRLTAVRRLAAEAADAGFLAPEIAAGIEKVRGARKLGVRTGNWLTREQASELLRAPNSDTLKGKRDRAILGLLVGCGLRRSEIASLEIDAIQQREARWVIADLVGKGKRVRTVPVPAWTKMLIDQWLTAAEVREGKLVRPIDKKGQLAGESVTPKVIWWIVLGYARQLGLANLAPHDLRRTCAKLCRASGGELEQIQLLLGHASIQTTEQYLGTRQNLVEAVNDCLGLEL